MKMRLLLDDEMPTLAGGELLHCPNYLPIKIIRNNVALILDYHFAGRLNQNGFD